MATTRHWRSGSLSFRFRQSVPRSPSCSSLGSRPAARLLGAVSVFFGALASTLVFVGLGLFGLVLAAAASGGFGVLARRLLDGPAAALTASERLTSRGNRSCCRHRPSCPHCRRDSHWVYPRQPLGWNSHQAPARRRLPAGSGRRCGTTAGHCQAAHLRRGTPGRSVW